MKGIKYHITGENSRARLNAYHSKPSVLDHSYGAEECDVKTIKKVVMGDSRNGYKSKYKIGFEIEKCSFGARQRKEYALIQGYERDGSCGVEAVTNILPLLPNSQWRMKIFDMMYKAKGIINDDISPSNINCGGHMSISVDGMTSNELYKAIRPNIAILMAMFRKRLRNRFCNRNLNMCENAPYNGTHWKYNMVSKKDFGVEIRMASRITSYKQMFRRYELMYEIVDFSVNKPNGRFATLLKKVEPILMSMYENDRGAVNLRMDLAKDFRNFVINQRLSERINSFLP